jgi:hypothetical protein
MKKIKAVAGMSLAIVVTALSLTACSGVATPTGMCGWVVGDGQSGHDAKVKKTLYPDEQVSYNSGSEVAQFVPCGPRNYLITDGSVKGVDGKPIGDRQTPIEATTATNTPVLVQANAFFVINQQPDALTKFKEFCNKYPCYTTKAEAGTSNFASDEWNGMLAENVGPAIEAATKVAMKSMPDEIWKTKDPELAKKLATELSTSFMEAFRVRTGYNVDLFCGSGNSSWDDPVKRNTFTCTNVRFEVTDVRARDAQAQNNANVESQEALAKKANESRFSSNQPLYGDQTGRWLGIQDTVKSCPQGSTCNFYLGESASK